VIHLNGGQGYRLHSPTFNQPNLSDLMQLGMCCAPKPAPASLLPLQQHFLRNDLISSLSTRCVNRYQGHAPHRDNEQSTVLHPNIWAKLVAPSRPIELSGSSTTTSAPQGGQHASPRITGCVSTLFKSSAVSVLLSSSALDSRPAPLSPRALPLVWSAMSSGAAATEQKRMVRTEQL